MAGAPIALGAFDGTNLRKLSVRSCESCISLRKALMKSYENEKDPSMRYNMLLEFSSYLRQGAAYSGGGKDGMGGAEGHLDDDGISLKWEIGRVLVIVSLVLVTVLCSAYYLGTMIDLNEDTEEL